MSLSKNDGIVNEFHILFSGVPLMGWVIRDHRWKTTVFWGGLMEIFWFWDYVLKIVLLSHFILINIFSYMDLHPVLKILHRCHLSCVCKGFHFICYLGENMNKEALFTVKIYLDSTILKAPSYLLNDLILIPMWSK